MTTTLDFGNGIIIDGFSSGIARGSSGLEVPQYEVPVNEFSLLDGGSVGSTRAKARRMTIKVLHDRLWSRQTISRAFSGGVMRTITSPIGSMPYYVDTLSFPENDLEAEREFTVSIVSPLAFPAGERRYTSVGSAGGGLEYPYEYPYELDSFITSDYIIVISSTDVVTPAKITATLAVAAADIEFSRPSTTKIIPGMSPITYGGCTTRITGPFSVGDVVVVDSQNHTVTVNGVNRLSWFDRDKDWFTLVEGANRISSTRLAVLEVEWTPRLMGLL